MRNLMVFVHKIVSSITLQHPKHLKKWCGGKKEQNYGRNHQNNAH